MSDARVDDLLHDLATALSIEPSPQMVARVRTRVYAGSPLRSPLGSWTVGAALAILTVAVALSVTPDRDAVRQPIVQTEARRTEVSRQVSEPPSLSSPAICTRSPTRRDCTTADERPGNTGSCGTRSRGARPAGSGDRAAADSPRDAERTLAGTAGDGRSRR